MIPYKTKTIRVGFFDYRASTQFFTQDYALIQRQVDIAMRHGSKDCIGEDCDLGFDCVRHSRTAELVGRYLRSRKNKSLRPPQLF